MPESRRAPSLPGSDAADRDSRAEALLVEGLDRYFNGRYEDAIHLWTRVLFLDRSHARARAYIDRARTALTERQRVAEQMLHESREWLARGQTAEARSLLTEAVATSGDDERAAALRMELERVERAAALDVALPVPVRPTPVSDRLLRPLQSRAVMTLLIGLAVSLFLVAASASPTVQSLVGLDTPPAPIASVAAGLEFPAPSRAEVALVRARTLFNAGRLAEALRVLDTVSADGVTRAEADKLRIDIQQLLLATGQKSAPEVRRPDGRQ